jgi:hypothetical protein
MTRQLHLGVFIYPGGHHIAAWRHPDMKAERITELDYYCQSAQIAERGKFDLFFVGDALNAREREGKVVGEIAINNLDPVSIVSAVASVTDRIGLVATLSTTYNEPAMIAAKFATLDHLSGGRAGWNVVTTLDEKAALNFSRSEAMEKSLRYQRAQSFVDDGESGRSRRGYRPCVATGGAARKRAAMAGGERATGTARLVEVAVFPGKPTVLIALIATEIRWSFF